MCMAMVIQWIAAARQWAFLEETNGCSTHFKVVVLLFGASVDGTSQGARNDVISRMEYPKPNEKPKNLRIRNNTAYLRDVERSQGYIAKPCKALLLV